MASRWVSTQLWVTIESGIDLDADVDSQVDLDKVLTENIDRSFWELFDKIKN